MPKQSYIVLARKYRPQGFDGLVGQASVSVTLKNAVAAQRLAQAYLFTGPRGVGKTTMARILAKALNCAKGPTPEPCGGCDSCREIGASSSLDVLEMDAASHTGVDNVREVIIETVGLAPTRDRFKVFIIDEAHMLSTAAFNALLKTLEEPPPHVVFVLATTEVAKIPATIASRCQRFRFRPVAPDVVLGHLREIARQEKIEIEPEALELLSQSSEGSLRDALSLLDQCYSSTKGKIKESQVREMFGFVPQDMLLGVAQALFEENARALGGWLQKIYTEGLEPRELLRDLRQALEEVYRDKLGGGTEASGAWKSLAAGVSAERLAFLLRRVNRILEELRFDDSPRLSLELGLFACLEAAADLGDWVRRLEALESRLQSGAGSIGVPPAPLGSRLAPPKKEMDSEVGRAEASPQPSSVGGDVAKAWPAVVAALRQDKASLAASLEKARMTSPEAGVLRLLFQRQFDLEGAKRSEALIVAKLSTIAGTSFRLQFEIDDKPAASLEEVVDPGIPEERGTPSAQWKDVTEASAGPEPPAALQKAQQILGGTVKVIKKKTSL